MKDLYDEFIVSFLRLLEPIQIHNGQILQKDGQEKMHNIYFVMEGTLEVGYNHKKFILEQGLEELEIPVPKDHPKYEIIKLKVVTNLIQDVQDKKQIEEKYQYPLKFKPG